MNHRRAAALAQRQRRLLARSGELRLHLAAEAAVLQRPLELADRVHQGWRWLRTHPEVPLVGLVVVAVLRPRRAWRWGMRLWLGWRTLQRVQRRLRAIG